MPESSKIYLNLSFDAEITIHSYICTCTDTTLKSNLLVQFENIIQNTDTMDSIANNTTSLLEELDMEQGCELTKQVWNGLYNNK